MSLRPIDDEQTRNHRLHALCPYFAMFPPAFARLSILAHTRPGDLVLDPFCGRGTALLEALLNGRRAVGCDINPVAYCVSAAKLDTPNLRRATDRIEQLRRRYEEAAAFMLEDKRRALPTFFRRAYSAETLRQVLFMRSRLRWRSDRIDRFLTAVLLGHLHGESSRSPNYLSNQMPHTISTKPGYSLRYWRRKDLWPPRQDVFELLSDRARFRLIDRRPKGKGFAIRADVRRAHERLANYVGRVRAVVTSPPYLDVTSFEEDQWLRLWFLGGPPHPTYRRISHDDRHRSWDNYWGFLESSWTGIAPLLQDKASLICRIGACKQKEKDIHEALIASVHSTWPKARLLAAPVRSRILNPQTHVFRPGATGCAYEFDFSFVLPSA